MRVISKLALGMILAVGTCTQAGAVLISGGALDGTNVGDIDIYRGETSGMSSGEQTEVDWVNSVLGTSFTTAALGTTENVAWHSTDMAGVIAFALASSPGYYLVKNANLHVVLENVLEYDWGVLNLADITGGLNLGDDFMISHVSEFGAQSVPVPEPASATLFGAALLGFGLMRRRRRV